MSRSILCLVILLAIIGSELRTVAAQQAADLSPDERTKFEQESQLLNQRLESHLLLETSAWADAAVYAKGLSWALKYDRQFTPADIQLLTIAGKRCHQRISDLQASIPLGRNRHGKHVAGYRSVVDGSVQPYGLIIPSSYDPDTPIRLDVVLHGSTRPVGMSELRFMARFDQDPDRPTAVPDHPYIELHPLGRVENCYRWAGETDVFEAIEDVCRRYNIDRSKIVLRGMSMGASGTWHLGLKHPDRFVALGPYCGYVDTHKFSETPIPGFVRVGPLPEIQELGLHMLDSVDYAANAGVVPAIACMGEKDVFFQAHVIMAEAMSREGLTMINLISPGTGHVIDPKTQAEQLRQIAEICAKGERKPQSMRFVTWTLKYNRCHWLEILGLDQHYARAEFSAAFKGEILEIKPPKNITRFAIAVHKLPSVPRALRVGEQELAFPLRDKLKPDRVIVARQRDSWAIENEEQSRENRANKAKRPGLQGPIDDAFTSTFLCVRGTGQPWSAAAQSYAQASLNRFSDEWHHYFRGELPIKNDTEVTPDDVRTKNLILFGDPGSNSLIAKVLPDLPLKWTTESFTLKGQEYDSQTHVPALIAPNPLSGNENYVVLNSGHTFRESDLAKFNYLLFPRWGDWAVLKLKADSSPNVLPEDHIANAGYFDETWK